MSDVCTNVRVPAETWEQLKKIADREDRTLHSVIRKALKEFLERQSVQDSES